MSTVPPAAALPLLAALVPLLLLLLLQPTAARAIAVRAAIAVVRLMFFLSSIEVSGQDHGPANVAASTSADDFPTLAHSRPDLSTFLTDPTEQTSVDDRDPSPLTAVFGSKFVQIRPS
jgi:hypothetical protein